MKKYQEYTEAEARCAVRQIIELSETDEQAIQLIKEKLAYSGEIQIISTKVGDDVPFRIAVETGRIPFRKNYSTGELLIVRVMIMAPDGRSPLFSK